MSRFIAGADRHQVTLLPQCLDDFVGEDNTVRIVDVFGDEVDLVALGFDGASPAATGRPSYHPSVSPANLLQQANQMVAELRYLDLELAVPYANPSTDS